MTDFPNTPKFQEIDRLIKSFLTTGNRKTLTALRQAVTKASKSPLDIYHIQRVFVSNNFEVSTLK